MKSILGIDPGLSGALALFDPLRGYLVFCHDMPAPRDDKGKRSIDSEALAKLIAPHVPDIIMVVLEQVHSMPGQGVASTFAFGRAYGAVEGVLGALALPINPAPPAVWKQRMRVTADKETSRARATEILPAHAACWRLKKHDGRAEAALLAVYGAGLLIFQK